MMNTIKKAAVPAVLGLCIAGALVLSSVSAEASLAGSGHDFTNDSAGDDAWACPGGACQPCSACHIAHTQQPATAGPLWNHDQPAGPFTPYASASMNASPDDFSGTSSVSESCLGCHDGITALDSYGGSAGTNSMTSVYGGGYPAILGTNLTQSHPVAFVYDATLATADGELYDPETYDPPTIAGTNVIEDELLFGATAGNRTLECASCHDVHNGAGVAKMLRMNNDGDQLCITCHDK